MLRRGMGTLRPVTHAVARKSDSQDRVLTFLGPTLVLALFACACGAAPPDVTTSLLPPRNDTLAYFESEDQPVRGEDEAHLYRAHETVYLGRGLFMHLYGVYDFGGEPPSLRQPPQPPVVCMYTPFTVQEDGPLVRYHCLHEGMLVTVDRRTLDIDVLHVGRGHTVVGATHTFFGAEDAFGVAPNGHDAPTETFAVPDSGHVVPLTAGDEDAIAALERGRDWRRLLLLHADGRTDPLPVPPRAADIAFANRRFGVAVDGDGRLHVTADGAEHWTVIHPPEGAERDQILRCMIDRCVVGNVLVRHVVSER